MSQPTKSNSLTLNLRRVRSGVRTDLNTGSNSACNGTVVFSGDTNSTKRRTAVASG